jgi:hypothetical protein
MHVQASAFPRKLSLVLRSLARVTSQWSFHANLLSLVISQLVASVKDNYAFMSFARIAV